MDTIHGRMALYTDTGFPYAGGEPRTVQVADVTALGKLTARGSQACVQFMVRLRDDSLMFVKACDQTQPVERWIRRIAKRIHLGYVSSWSEGWRCVWSDITPDDGAAPAKKTRVKIGPDLARELYSHEVEIVHDDGRSDQSEGRLDLVDAIESRRSADDGSVTLLLSTAAVSYLREDAIGAWLHDWEDQELDALVSQGRDVLRQLRGK